MVSRPMNPPLRAPDTAPLPKRPRLTATPSSSSSSTPLSFHTPSQDPAADVQDARRASSMRVLNAWAELAERYNRRLDEDDVVDLWSGAIIKDRGVLRGTAHHDIGHFPLDDPSEPFGDDHDQNDQEDDDEVDSSVPEPDISQTFVAERINRNVPPMRGMESADAEDLNEFLEAERKRQDLYAEEDYLSNEDLAALRKVLAEQDKDSSDKEPEDGNATERGETQPEEATRDDADVSSSSDIEITHINFDPPTDDESEDELGVWERDEASAVYQVSRDREQEDISRIENEVIDLSDSPTPSPPPTPPRVPVSERSGTVPRRSVAPKACQRSKSRGKSKSRAAKSREREHIPASPLLRQDSPVIDGLALQLQTPPRSSSFQIENPPQNSSKAASLPPLEAPPLSPEIGAIMDVELPPPVLEVPTYEAAPMIDLLSKSKRRRSPQKAPETHSKTPKKPSKPRLVPEVLIIRKSTSGKLKKQVTARDRDSDKEVVETSDDAEAEAISNTPVEKRIPAKEKGKGRELRDTLVVHKVAPAAKGPPTKEPAADEDFVNGSPSSTQRLPSHPPETSKTPLRGRKRKRLPSSTLSEPLEGSTHNVSAASPVLDSPPFRYSNSRPASPSDHDSHQFRDQDRRVEREHRHFSSVVPSVPLPTPVPSSDRTASPYYPYPYSQPYSAPHHPSTSHPYPETPQSYPPHMDPMQTQHAQYLLAQAMHHLSFLMSSNGHAGPGQPPWMQHSAPPPASYPHPSYPPPSLPSPPPWPPYTPTHHISHQSRPPPPLHSRSDSSSSSIPFMHQTPVPAQSFSNMVTPSSSQATFPPSSPELLSLALSTGDGEVTRPKSLVRGRSKSRGRRVSFVLNDEHRPRSADSPSTSENRGKRRCDSPVDELDAWATEDRYAQDTSDKQRSRPMTSEHASHRSQSSIRRVAVSSMDEKLKGMRRSQVVNDDKPSTPLDSRGQRIERGRTPGPPNRHEVSETSALSKRGRSRSVVAADKPSRTKK